MAYGNFVDQLHSVDDQAKGHLAEQLFVVLFPIFAVILFYFFRVFVASGAHNSGDYVILLSSALLFAALFWRLRAEYLTPPCRIVLRVLTALFALYFASYTPGAIPISTTGASLDTLYGWLRIGVLAIAALSLWRPSFAIVVFCLGYWQGDMLKQIRGIGLGSTDVTIVLEFGATLAMGVMALFALDAVRRKSSRYVLRQPVTREAMDFLLLMLVAAHFANYFFSGVQKLILDGGLLSWILENKTTNLVLATMQTGHFPVPLNDVAKHSLLQVVHNMPFNTALNLVVLTLQLAAILAFLRIGVMRALCILYDGLHLGIFLLTGVFFWKWIILNTALAFALRKLPLNLLNRSRAIALVFYLLSANVTFSIAWLGWYDTGSQTRSYILAETAAGKLYHVPTNYFLGVSNRFAMGDFAALAAPGFPTPTMGATMHYATMINGNACHLPIESRRATSYLDELKIFLLHHHLYVLEHADTKGHIAYDLFPHHIWSNLSLFSDFEELDKRTIVAYQWIIKSECLDVDEKGLKVTLRDERHFTIQLPRAPLPSQAEEKNRPTVGALRPSPK